MLLHYRASEAFGLPLAKYRKVLLRYVMVPIETTPLFYSHNTFQIPRSETDLPTAPRSATFRANVRDSKLGYCTNFRASEEALGETRNVISACVNFLAEWCTYLQRGLDHVSRLIEVDIQLRQQRRVETWRDAVIVVPAALMAIAVIIAIVQVSVVVGIVPVRRMLAL